MTGRTVWMVQVHEEEAVTDDYGFSFVPVLHASLFTALEHAAKLRATIPDIQWKAAEPDDSTTTVWYYDQADAYGRVSVIIAIRVMTLTILD